MHAAGLAQGQRAYNDAGQPEVVPPSAAQLAGTQAAALLVSDFKRMESGLHRPIMTRVRFMFEELGVNFEAAHHDNLEAGVKDMVEFGSQFVRFQQSALL